MTGRGLLAWLAVSLAAAFACEPQRPVRAPRQTTRAQVPTFAFESPARWRYHPRDTAALRARESLGPGLVLLAGARGERWLFDSRTQKLDSALPAPEDLVAILRTPGGGYSFVGKTGATYRADEPLGSFTASTLPFDPLAQVAGGHGTLLGVRRDRRLVRSADAGASWSLVGPEGASFVDVALDAEGGALALAVPEALYFSRDSGATFTRLDTPTRGAFGLEHPPFAKAIFVHTVLGPHAWSSASPEQLERRAAAAESALLPQGVEPPAGPDAGALAEGRAAWVGSQYVELRPDRGTRTGSFKLLSGPLEGPLASRPVAELKGCRTARLAGAGRLLALACFRGPADLTQPIELFASNDLGASVAPVELDVFAKLSEFRMALGAGGDWLLTGVCAAGTEGPGCAPNGVQRLERAFEPSSATKATRAEKQKKRPRLVVAAAPGLQQSALDLAFGVDEKTAFAVGRTTKASGLSLFASVDGGHTFELRELELSGSNEEQIDRVSLVPASDATVALVLGKGLRAAWMVADDQGRVLSVAAPPEPARLGAAGLSAVAVAPDGRVWESLDGGGSWERAGSLPAPLCPDDAACDVPIACSSRGCIVGDELTRIGWGRIDDVDVSSTRAVGRALRGGETARFGVPLACTLLPGGFRPLPGARALPGASESALGSVAWFVSAEEPESAAAVVYHARGGARPRVEVTTLLAPVTAAKSYAYQLVPQVEGAAAIRYPVPDAKASQARLRDVEVAWANWLEGRVTRQRVPDGGPYSPGDFVALGARAQAAKPDLVSIAEKGLYLRLHASAGSRQPTLFLDGKTITTVPPSEWPDGVPKEGRSEMAHLGDRHLGLYLAGPSLAVVRGQAGPAGSRFDAVTIGTPNPSAFGLYQGWHIAYVGERVGFHVEVVDPRERSARSELFPLRADGPVVDAPVPVPTQLDLASRPAACAAAERSSTPRIVASMLPGTRHPVVITDAIDPPRAMVTGDAVLHGTPESPCAASFELLSLRSEGDPGVDERGIVLLDDLEHAWLLRRSDPPGASAPLVEYRSMSCRFDPALEVPEEVLQAPDSWPGER